MPVPLWNTSSNLPKIPLSRRLPKGWQMQRFTICQGHCRVSDKRSYSYFSVGQRPLDVSQGKHVIEGENGVTYYGQTGCNYEAMSGNSIEISCNITKVVNPEFQMKHPQCNGKRSNVTDARAALDNLFFSEGCLMPIQIGFCRYIRRLRQTP